MWNDEYIQIGLVWIYVKISPQPLLVFLFHIIDDQSVAAPHSIGMKCYKLIKNHKNPDSFNNGWPNTKKQIYPGPPGSSALVMDVTGTLMTTRGFWKIHRALILVLLCFCLGANGISASCWPFITTTDTIWSCIQKTNQGWPRLNSQTCL